VCVTYSLDQAWQFIGKLSSLLFLFAVWNEARQHTHDGFVHQVVLERLGDGAKDLERGARARNVGILNRPLEREACQLLSEARAVLFTRVSSRQASGPMRGEPNRDESRRTNTW